MATYRVLLEAKATVAQAAVQLTVKYDDEDYNAAWVGARTVCRLGTLFKDDPNCKKPSNAREFFHEDGKPCPVNAGVFTVRRIFAENTRKKGKQRMTILTAEELMQVLASREIEVSDELKSVFDSAINAGGGIKITVATAKRLGLDPKDFTPPGKETPETKTA